MVNWSTDQDRKLGSEMESGFLSVRESGLSQTETYLRNMPLFSYNLIYLYSYLFFLELS